MNRRDFVKQSLGAAAGAAAATAAPAMPAGRQRPSRRCEPLANDYTVLWKASDPMHEIGYCPALARLPSGRLIGCMLHAGTDLVKPREWTVKVHTSDDRGRTWPHRIDVKMIDCFPFVAGSSVYVIGGRHDLTIIRSDDEGTTWTSPVKLTEGKLWYCHPGSAVYANGRIYFVMEQITAPIDRGFPTHVFAPVVLSARLSDDLTRPEAWTYSNAISFQDVLDQEGSPNLLGVPFYKPGRYEHPTSYRGMAPIGWGETNLVEITDPDNIWHDPTGHTFHLLSRAVTGRTNVACLARAVESEDGKTITVGLQKAPSGETMLYVPLPGGQVSFHIVYDEPTRRFWMISSQATDSMKRVELLHPKRYNMPNQERHRLVLHFSKNCVDWCFAAVVAKVDDVGQSHHGGNMLIDGDDLHVLMRTADANAKNAHNSNLITFHTIERFRELVY
jgi:hypothetical protein